MNALDFKSKNLLSRIISVLLIAISLGVVAITVVKLKPGNLDNRAILAAPAISLDWEISEPENTVTSKIYRSTNGFLDEPSSTQFIAEVASPAHTYTDTSVGLDTLYYYSVFLIDGDGEFFDPAYFALRASNIASPSPSATPAPTPAPAPAPAATSPTLTPSPAPAPAPQPQNLLQMPTTPPAPIVPSPQSQSLPVGTLIQDGQTIYVVTEPLVAVAFTSYPAFTGLGYSLRHVVASSISSYRVSSNYYITSPAQEHPWSAWVLYRGTVYYVSPEGLIGVPSREIFINNGGQDKFVLPANGADTQILNTNPNLPVLKTNDPRVIK